MANTAVYLAYAGLAFMIALSGIGSAISSVSSFFGFGDSDISVSSKKETSLSSVQKLENEVKTTGVQSSNSMIYQGSKSNSKVVHNTPTYHITVQEPKSDVDVIKAMKTYEQQQRNRSYEDD